MGDPCGLKEKEKRKVKREKQHNSPMGQINFHVEKKLLAAEGKRSVKTQITSEIYLLAETRQNYRGPTG